MTEIEPRRDALAVGTFRLGVSTQSGVLYLYPMTMKTKPERRTTSVPVTTMEEVPVLGARERADVLDTLREAETDIAAGKGIAYQPKRFRDRLLSIYRGTTR